MARLAASHTVDRHNPQLVARESFQSSDVVLRVDDVTDLPESPGDVTMAGRLNAVLNDVGHDGVLEVTGSCVPAQ